MSLSRGPGRIALSDLIPPRLPAGFHLRLREVLLKRSQHEPGGAVLLSGGVDSATVLAAKLANGERPRCYTMALVGQRSADLTVATAMCQAYGLEHVVVEVPIARHRIVEQLGRVLPQQRAYYRRLAEVDDAVDPDYISKVTTQVMCCMEPVLDRAWELGDDRLWTGFCADSFWGSARSDAKLLAAEGVEAWRAYRDKYLIHPINSEACLGATLAAARGIELVDGWHSPAIVELFAPRTPVELNRPFPKAPAVYAFHDFWSRGSWRRPNSSLQVNCGLRELHDRLLDDAELNPKGRKAVVALYRDLLEGSDHG